MATDEQAQKEMNAAQVIHAMIRLEQKRLEPDERRCILEARTRLQGAVLAKVIQDPVTRKLSADPERISAALANALTVVNAWGHNLFTT